MGCACVGGGAVSSTTEQPLNKPQKKRIEEESKTLSVLRKDLDLSIVEKASGNESLIKREELIYDPTKSLTEMKKETVDGSKDRPDKAEELKLTSGRFEKVLR
jgi:hypothetical protein